MGFYSRLCSKSGDSIPAYPSAGLPLPASAERAAVLKSLPRSALKASIKSYPMLRKALNSTLGSHHYMEDPRCPWVGIPAKCAYCDEHITDDNFVEEADEWICRDCFDKQAEKESEKEKLTAALRGEHFQLLAQTLRKR